MPQGFISIGSNINRDSNIASSLTALRNAFGDLTCSSVYESAAVGFEGEAFYNMVVSFDSALSAQDVADLLRKIEAEHGRTRECRKFSSRTLDLDLILYGNQIINEDRLQIPRNEIERYAFVLEPLAEISPNLKHPVTGESYADLWRNFNKTDLQQIKVNTRWESAK